jgi:hypothetical protein
MFGLSQGGDFSNLNQNEINAIKDTEITDEQAPLLGYSTASKYMDAVVEAADAFGAEI